MENTVETKENELKTLKVSAYTHTMVSEMQKAVKASRRPKRKPTQDEIVAPLIEKAFKRLVRA